jgi:hypothetical protein
MSVDLFGEVLLAYEILWNAQRQVAGVILSIEVADDDQANLNLLANALFDWCKPQTYALTLGSPSITLLIELLGLATNGRARVVVSSEQMNDPRVTDLVRHAKQLGLTLLWHGQPGERLMPALADNFSDLICDLDVDQTVMALRFALHQKLGTQKSPPLRGDDPVRAEHIYDAIASKTLADHCLDHQQCKALLGWPIEDVLHGYRQSGSQPEQTAMRDLLKAIEGEASMDEIEFWLGQDPVLAYRFLRFTNSAALGLSRTVESLRQGLMLLGLSQTRHWLLDLLPRACQDLNLHPIRQTMVLRARFMAELADANEQESIKRELYLCGLLSQIDLLVGESMPAAMGSIPLPGHVKEAIAAKSGHFWPYLDMALSIECRTVETMLERCQQHNFELEEVNLAMLRTLATLK